MHDATADDLAASWGFLTTVDSAAHGVFGGYLVIDATGRPLEFHCTTPVKVSRAQQILYGATLPAHLHGRQIGGALLEEAGSTPVVVLTDSEAMLHVRPHTSLPVVLVRRCGDEVSGQGGGTLVVGHTHVTPPADAGGVVSHLEALAAAVDLCEPFERIRAAIDEAQRH